MRAELTLRLELRRLPEQRQVMARTPEPAAIGEDLAHLLTVQREIRGLLGRPSLADEIWARLEREGG